MSLNADRGRTVIDLQVCVSSIDRSVRRFRAEHSQGTFLGGRGFEVVEVVCRDVVGKRIVVRVLVAPCRESSQCDCPWRREIDRLRNYSKRAQQVPIDETGTLGSEREVEYHVLVSRDERDEVGAELLLDLFMHIARQGHRPDAPAPGFLVE